MLTSHWRRPNASSSAQGCTRSASRKFTAQHANCFRRAAWRRCSLVKVTQPFRIYLRMINARRFLVVLTATAVLIGGWLLATRASNDPQTAKSEAATSVSTSNASVSPSDSVLTREIDRIIDESDSAHARW